MFESGPAGSGGSSLENMCVCGGGGAPVFVFYFGKLDPMTLSHCERLGGQGAAGATPVSKKR